MYELWCVFCAVSSNSYHHLNIHVIPRGEYGNEKGLIHTKRMIPYCTYASHKDHNLFEYWILSISQWFQIFIMTRCKIKFYYFPQNCCCIVLCLLFSFVKNMRQSFSICLTICSASRNDITIECCNNCCERRLNVSRLVVMFI